MQVSQSHSGSSGSVEPLSAAPRTLTRPVGSQAVPWRPFRVAATQSNRSTPRAMPSSRSAGKPDTHKITGRLAGQGGLERLQHAVHDRLGLADREPADGDAGPGAARERALERAAAEVVVGAALEDRPEGLADGGRADGRRSDVRLPDRLPPAPPPASASCLALHRSSHRSVRSIPSQRQLVRRLAGHDVVERHGDVGAEGPLDLHGALGRERAVGAVDVALELDAVLADASEALEREHLEAAGIGEHRARPGGEAVEPAHRANHLLAGAEMQMVGVAEDDLRAGARHVAGLRPRTTPWVPTGMNAGVGTVPCGRVSVPARAGPGWPRAELEHRRAPALAAAASTRSICRRCTRSCRPSAG